MLKLLATTSLVCLLASPSFAQTATATGTGVGVANSKSQSNALAISGQGGNVNRSGNSSSALTVNSAAAPAVTSSNITTGGSSSVKTVPSVFAPGLGAAGLETCLGSVSGGGSALGWGATFGTTVPDPGCAARLDARTLWAMGLKGAAVARLCQMIDIYNSMPDVCAKYMPQGARPNYARAEVTAVTARPVYAGNEGRIELIDGKTGAARWCDNYDAVKHHCRAWSVLP